MRQVILAVVLSVPIVALAQEITLVCKGWAPHYQNFSSAPVNGSSDDDYFLIDLDLKKRTAKYETQIGKVITPIKEEDRAYGGTVDIGKEAGGKHVASIGFLANRMTGKTNITYHFRDSGDMRVLFSGKCEPGKPIF